MCETRVLATHGTALISQCAECKVVYIWQNNLLFTFNMSRFNAFKKFVYDLEFDERSLPFPDGADRAVLRSPEDSISFAFTREEWMDFKWALDDASCMMEVYKIL
ncbi:hypothetical protein C8P68_102280 [Mucilaginibacter yixingensis]|uniref:Uncharacterized protein n=1 Tax=Mucilaginibacter yixingensis TaxID=1295612 RepID=A0A2T5JCG8_9SPHI|nr:DUF6686 family protein [Mucilaginibacter yixingensis]PTQ99456.1 hypothetical protein C8P68_102280 [Mucilaginibacter yixingensis]